MHFNDQRARVPQLARLQREQPSYIRIHIHNFEFLGEKSKNNITVQIATV